LIWLLLCSLDRVSPLLRLRCEAHVLLWFLGPGLRVLLLLMLLMLDRCCEAVGFRWRERGLVLILGRIRMLLSPWHRPIRAWVVPSHRLLWLLIPWIRCVGRRGRRRSPLMVCLRSDGLVWLMTFGDLSAPRHIDCVLHISNVHTSVAWRWWRYWRSALLPREARRAPWPLVSRRLSVVLHRYLFSLTQASTTV
jgi:hypothetical protein